MENFYVYAILDPRKKKKSTYYVDEHEIIFEYEPFYIGKGKKWRLTQHFYKCSLKKNTYKNNKILKIINEGYKPISIKIIEKLTEIEAYNLEIKVISSIGLQNLTNKTEGGVGQCSSSMIGNKNPMFGKHPIPWNKGTKGQPSKFKGMKMEEICGEEKAKTSKEKQSNSRKGKSWEEYFGEETAKRIKEERKIQRTGTKHSEETKKKIKEKICTPENILKRKKIMILKRKNKFDLDFVSNKDQIEKLINNGYKDNEIIKRIDGISRFRVKKMIFLIKNNLDSNYYFDLSKLV